MCDYMAVPKYNHAPLRTTLVMSEKRNLVNQRLSPPPPPFFLPVQVSLQEELAKIQNGLWNVTAQLGAVIKQKQVFVSGPLRNWVEQKYFFLFISTQKGLVVLEHICPLSGEIPLQRWQLQLKQVKHWYVCT